MLRFPVLTTNLPDPLFAMKNPRFACLSLTFLSLGGLLWSPTLRGQQPPPPPAPAGVAAPTPPIQTGGEVAANTSAEVWLALIDDGQFDKSWDSAAKILQDLVNKQEWIELAKTKRPPLGKVVSRQRKEITAARTLPGAPEGQYVVIQYTTEFEHKKTALETVTVALDTAGGGQWKVSGYYIR